MSDLLTFAVFCLSKIVERFIHIKSSTPPCNPAVMVSAFDLKPSVPQHTRKSLAGFPRLIAYQYHIIFHFRLQIFGHYMVGKISFFKLISFNLIS